jgi:type VI secretion system secreted protein VgrG
MTLIEKYVAFTKKWEGGLSRDKDDSASAYPCPTKYNGKSGWHTNAGITYTAWVQYFGKENDERFFLMAPEDWFKVFKKGYWDGVKGDQFKVTNIAIIVTGVAWGSGAHQAGMTLQRAINNCGVLVSKDGIIGNNTIKAANSVNPTKLFDAIADERERFFRAIGRPGTKNAKFLTGWLNRLSDYRKTFRP